MNGSAVAPPADGGGKPRHHQLIPDPSLAPHGATVTAALARYAAQATTADLHALMDPAISAVFSSAMASVHADSSAIWLLDPAHTHLVAGFTLPHSGLVGEKQPLSEGMIPLVIASEQPLCENAVYRDTRHSKHIDESLGKTTEALIAVPFYLGGTLRGVVSCVRWKKADSPVVFTAANLDRVRQLANTLERLLNYQLLKVILDFEA